MVRSALLLDLDGTVWDSRPWYAATISRLSGAPESKIERKQNEGFSVVELLSAFEVSKAQLEREASTNCISLNLYEGVLETLDLLSQRNVQLGIVSNLPGWLVNALLDCKGIKSHFSTTVTPRRGIPAKPKPQGIMRALQNIGLSEATEAWFVGDGSVDATAAEAAAIPFAWASYGYESSEPTGTTRSIEHFEEVLDL